MKKLRVYVCLIIVILISFSFTSCNYINGNRIAKEVSEEIIRCFDEKDAESLKNMFFANSLPTSNLDKQIKEAFEFYKGPSVSYIIPKGLGGGESVDDGKITMLDVHPRLENIETDSEITYIISSHMYIIYEGEEMNKITYMNIYNKNNPEEKVTIGKYFY